jgi:hypothetical protein
MVTSKANKNKSSLKDFLDIFIDSGETDMN